MHDALSTRRFASVDGVVIQGIGTTYFEKGLWIRGSVKGLKYPTGGLQYTWGLTRSDMNIWTPLGAGQS